MRIRLIHRTTLALTLFMAASASFATTPDSTEAKLTAYPVAWDKTHRGTALDLSYVRKVPVFRDDTRHLSVGADGATGVKWYAPIHAQLGTGKMAQASDRQAIDFYTNCLALRTRNPNTKDGVDVNIQSMDSKGHGFAITNGYVEVAAELPTAHGSHSGIWLDSVQSAAGHGEIDVVESYGASDPHTAHEAVHWWPTKASRFSKMVAAANYPSVVNLQAHWHNYGVLLTPTEITTYIDRKEVGRIARLPEDQAPFYILLSVFTDANRKDGYQPAMLRIASVTAWE